MSSQKLPQNWHATAAKQKNIPLPEKFKCRDCNKFKPPTLFSNKELNGFRWKKTNNLALNGITAKIRCRSCSGDQTQELQCMGPCGLWRGLDEFSKNQRKRPQEAWCSICTQWKEANEPGITPMAAPNAILAPDEEKVVTEDGVGFAAYSGAEIEGDPDSEEDGDGGPGFIYSSMSAMSMGANAGKHEGSAVAGSIGPVAGNPPTGFLGGKMVPKPDKSLSSLSNPYATRSEYSGESSGIRAEGSAQGSSTTEYKFNPMDNGSQHHQMGLGWSVADRKRRDPGVPYNAWDNFGQVHSRIRLPSTTDGASSDIQGSSTTQRMSSTQVASPAQVVLTGRGGWAKNTSNRANPPTQFPPASHPVKQNNFDFDDDDEQDEM